MTWVVVVSGVIFAVWAVLVWAALRLIRMAAPETEEERRAEDEAQIEWLHRGGKNSPPPPEPSSSSSPILTPSRVHVSSAACLPQPPAPKEGSSSRHPSPFGRKPKANAWLRLANGRRDL